MSEEYGIWETHECASRLMNFDEPTYIRAMSCETPEEIRTFCYNRGILSDPELSRVDFNEVFRVLHDLE